MDQFKSKMSVHTSDISGATPTQRYPHYRRNSSDFYSMPSYQHLYESTDRSVPSTEHLLYPLYQGGPVDVNVYGTSVHGDYINPNKTSLPGVFDRSVLPNSIYARKNLHHLRFLTSEALRGSHQGRFLLERSEMLKLPLFSIRMRLEYTGACGLFDVTFSKREAGLALIIDNVLAGIGSPPEWRSSNDPNALGILGREFSVTQERCMNGLAISWWPKWFVHVKEVTSIICPGLMLGIITQLDGTDGFGFAILIELPDDELVKFIIMCCPHFRTFEFTIDRNEFIKYYTIHGLPTHSADKMNRYGSNLKSSPHPSTGVANHVSDSQAELSRSERCSKTTRSVLDDDDWLSSIFTSRNRKILRNDPGPVSELTDKFQKLPPTMLPLFESAPTASIAGESSFRLADKYVIVEHISSDVDGVCKIFGGLSTSGKGEHLIHAFGLSKFELKYGNEVLNRRRTNYLATLLEHDAFVEVIYCHDHVWVVCKSTIEQWVDLLWDSSTFRPMDDTYLENFFQQDSESEELQDATALAQKVEAIAIETKASPEIQSNVNKRLINRKGEAQRRRRQRKREQARAAKSASTESHDGELVITLSDDNIDLSSLEMPLLLVADGTNISPSTTEIRYNLVSISAALSKLGLE